mgnify:CR=1 FL=1
MACISSLLSPIYDLHDISGFHSQQTLPQYDKSDTLPLKMYEMSYKTPGSALKIGATARHVLPRPSGAPGRCGGVLRVSAAPQPPPALEVARFYLATPPTRTAHSLRDLAGGLARLSVAGRVRAAPRGTLPAKRAGMPALTATAPCTTKGCCWRIDIYAARRAK